MKLLRYIQGLRKGKDAHRIEKDAMTDPFLSDALEGFDSVEGNHAERIERMQRRLTQLSQKDHNVAASRIAAKKVAAYSEVVAEDVLCAEMSFDDEKVAANFEPPTSQKKKRRSLVIWLAAAILLLFFATGGYFWLQKEEPTPPQLAATTDKTSTKKDIAADEKTESSTYIEHSETADDRVLAQDARENTERREQQTIPDPTVSTPLSIFSEEEHIYSDMDFSASFGNLDSILDLTRIKQQGSTPADLLAYKRQADTQLIIGDYYHINTDEISGIHYNTNRYSLSQGRARASKEKKKENKYDPHALTQSQIYSQGKVGGMLADQSRPAASKPPQAIPHSYMQGQVVDQNGYPIPFASIRTNEEGISTTANADGYFSLNTKNAEKIIASSVGHQSVELPIDTSQVLIALNETPEVLNDVVVVGYATQKKQSITGAMSTVSSSKTESKKQKKEAKTQPTAQLSGTVKGKVVDQHGEPIPYATVQVKGSTNATVTDMEGYFALNAKNAEKLVASYIGFDSIELPADTSKPMTIAMNETPAQLDEMVITAYGVNRTDDYSANQGLTIPEPTSGYSAYRQYINENMIKPSGECADVKGRVVLVFYVNNSGRPYNIEVRRSLCSAADQEAIRLVQEGERWTTGDGQVRLSIKF